MSNPLSAVWAYLRGADLQPPVTPLPTPATQSKAQPVVEQKLYYNTDVGAAIRLGTLVHGPGASELLGMAYGAGQDGNSAVFATITTICNAYSAAPLRVYRRTRKGSPEIVDNHPLEQLLRRPNPHMTGKELVWWMQWALHVYGNAYWRKVRAGNPLTGNVIELWPVSPSTLAPRTTREDRARGVFISHYRWEYETGKHVDLPVENIVHFKYGVDDYDHRLGTSPLKRLLREVMTDDEATKFTDALLRNYAVPGLVAQTQADLDEATADAIKQKLSTKFGTGNQGNVAVLDNGMTMTQFGFSPQQMNLDALHKFPETRIAAAFNVPAIVVGLAAGLERCIIGNMRVATPDRGPVAVRDIAAGDTVWAVRDGRLAPAAVTWAGQTGQREVFTLKTPNRTITATDNHPFLVRRMEKRPAPMVNHRHSAENHYWLEWVPLRDVRAGDFIVEATAFPDVGRTTLPDGTPATVPLLEWCGAFVGDGCFTGGARDVGLTLCIPPADRVRGHYETLTASLFSKYAGGGERPWKRAADGLTEEWIRRWTAGESYHQIAAAYGRHNATVRDRIQTALHPKPVQTAPVFVQEARNGFRISSASGSRWLRSLGFARGARAKGIPAWVFTLTEPLRLAFLRGLLDTDGSVDKRGVATFTFASETLTWDTWHLALSCGLQVSNVRHGRQSAKNLPNPGRQAQYEYWTFVVSTAADVRRIGTHDPLYQERLDRTTIRPKPGRLGNHPKSAAILPEGCGFTVVQSITPAGTEAVYDLTIAGAHNFVAQGLVIHNSTFSNVREAREMLFEQKILPSYEFDAARLDLQLLPDFATDPALFCAYDILDVRALQEDENERWARLTASLEKGGITRNTYLNELGYDPESDEDVIYVPSSVTPTKPEDLAAEPEPTPLPAPDQQGKDGQASGTTGRGRLRLVNGSKASAVRPQLTPQDFPELFDALRALAEPALTDELDAYLDGQRRRIKARLLADATDSGTADPDTARAALPRAAGAGR